MADTSNRKKNKKVRPVKDIVKEGASYYRGEGVDKDYKKAADLFGRASHYYHKGIGTDKNVVEAYKLLKLVSFLDKDNEWIDKISFNIDEYKEIAQKGRYPEIAIIVGDYCNNNGTADLMSQFSSAEESIKWYELAIELDTEPYKSTAMDKALNLAWFYGQFLMLSGKTEGDEVIFSLYDKICKWSDIMLADMEESGKKDFLKDCNRYSRYVVCANCYLKGDMDSFYYFIGNAAAPRLKMLKGLHILEEAESDDEFVKAFKLLYQMVFDDEYCYKKKITELEKMFYIDAVTKWSSMHNLLFGEDPAEAYDRLNEIRNAMDEKDPTVEILADEMRKYKIIGEETIYTP